MYEVKSAVHCPHCGRQGALKLQYGYKIHYRHDCPGPFMVGHVEPVKEFGRPPWQITYTYRHWACSWKGNGKCWVCQRYGGGHT